MRFFFNVSKIFEFGCQKNDEKIVLLLADVFVFTDNVYENK